MNLQTSKFIRWSPLSFSKHLAGKRNFQDPDTIYDIGWKSVDELKTIDLSFPEDREFLIDYITNRQI